MLPVCYPNVFENTRMYPYVTGMLPVSVYPCGVLVKLLRSPLKEKNSTRVERSLAFPSYPFPVPQMEVNFWLRPCAKQSQNPYSQVWAPTFVPGQFANQDDGKLETHFR